MVAFVVSFAIAILGMVVIHLYGRHRPVGAPLTWGEAIVAATFVFFLMFWAYGVVPNQWLQWANNELGWTPVEEARTESVNGPSSTRRCRRSPSTTRRCAT